MLKLFKQYKYLQCSAVYTALYWRSWKGCHFLAHHACSARASTVHHI